MPFYFIIIFVPVVFFFLFFFLAFSNLLHTDKFIKRPIDSSNSKAENNFHQFNKTPFKNEMGPGEPGQSREEKISL